MRRSIASTWKPFSSAGKPHKLLLGPPDPWPRAPCAGPFFKTADYPVVLNDNVYTCAASAPTQPNCFPAVERCESLSRGQEPTYEKTVSASPMCADCNGIDRLLHTSLGTRQHPHGFVRQSEIGPGRKLESSRNRLCRDGEKSRVRT